MPSAANSNEISLLLELIDQAYDKKAWHGPNLRGSVRRVDAAQAEWRPGAGRRCVAEIVVHAAYWKYAARRRIRGDKRGSFAMKGSNWFAIASPLDETTWRSYVHLLDVEHGALRDAVAALPVAQLRVVPPGSKVNYAALIEGIAAHDIYHAGQIQLLKRLWPKAVGR
jgi:hypothetical protein